MRQDEGISAPKNLRSILPEHPEGFFDPRLGSLPADAGAFWYHHDGQISGPGGTLGRNTP